MIDPVTFYRKLEALLNQINTGANNTYFLTTVLRAIEEAFGEELCIRNGRLYEDQHGAFMLFREDNDESLPDFSTPDQIEGEAVQLVLKHGSYIFDATQSRAFKRVSEDTVPVAFVVIRAPNERGLFVFDLAEGWVREEVLLCLNTVRSALNNRFYTESIKSNLAQAAQIQRSLLPERSPSLEVFDVAGRSQPAEDVGGDLYDYYRFQDGALGICIGDASGHGIPAALLVRDVVTGLRMGVEANLKISYTIKKLNQVIHQSSYSTQFVTLFYGDVEENGNIFFINAGHPPPLLIKNDAIEALDATGTVLGPLSEFDIYRSYAHMDVGANLVLYTDGIIERTDRTGDQFGVERLQSCILAHQGLDASSMVEVLFDEVYAFGESRPWEDDATIVVVKRKAAQKRRKARW